jgi:hypothetical protein
MREARYYECVIPYIRAIHDGYYNLFKIRYNHSKNSLTSYEVVCGKHVRFVRFCIIQTPTEANDIKYYMLYTAIYNRNKMYIRLVTEHFKPDIVSTARALSFPVETSNISLTVFMIELGYRLAHDHILYAIINNDMRLLKIMIPYVSSLSETLILDLIHNHKWAPIKIIVSCHKNLITEGVLTKLIKKGHL